MKTNRQHEQKASCLFENKNNYYICMSVWYGCFILFRLMKNMLPSFRKGFESNLLKIKSKK